MGCLNVFVAVVVTVVFGRQLSVLLSFSVFFQCLFEN